MPNTDAERAACLQAARAFVSQAEIDAFLRESPGDECRLNSAFAPNPGPGATVTPLFQIPGLTSYSGTPTPTPALAFAPVVPLVQPPAAPPVASPAALTVTAPLGGGAPAVPVLTTGLMTTGRELFDGRPGPVFPAAVAPPALAPFTGGGSSAAVPPATAGLGDNKLLLLALAVGAYFMFVRR